MNSTRHITRVGIGYKARHGKDTCAKSILESFSGKYDVRQYALADALKREVNEQDQFEMCLRYGVSYDPSPTMNDPLCQTRHGKQSRLLQYWGQYKRLEDKYYWVKKLHQRIEEDAPQFALITDVRYMNELLYVKSLKGYTIKCTRQGFTDFSRDPNHISETELDGVQFDYELTVPDGQVEELKKDALIVFDMIVADVAPPMPDLEELNAASSSD